MEHRREAAVRSPNLEPKEGRYVGRLMTTASVIGVPGDEPKGEEGGEVQRHVWQTPSDMPADDGDDWLSRLACWW